MTAPLLSHIALRYSGHPNSYASAGVIITSAAFLLALVWTLNFFIILPWLNPAFVTLMPYSVSLASKLLFGVTMGIVLYNMPRRKKAGALIAAAARHHSNE